MNQERTKFKEYITNIQQKYCYKVYSNSYFHMTSSPRFIFAMLFKQTDCFEVPVREMAVMKNNTAQLSTNLYFSFVAI